jgi:5'-nucleotidase
MQNRRAFIKNLAAGSVGVSLLGDAVVSLAAQSDEYTKLTVLHTNDWHSHIDPFPADAPRHANEGGIARRSALIKQIREEEENVLLLDAGDVFQGTPYFNFYKGKDAIKFNRLHYWRYRWWNCY